MVIHFVDAVDVSVLGVSAFFWGLVGFMKNKETGKHGTVEKIGVAVFFLYAVCLVLRVGHLMGVIGW
jgi:hypothetical protein